MSSNHSSNKPPDAAGDAKTADQGEIYYDGDCPMCNNFAERLGAHLGGTHLGGAHSGSPPSTSPEPASAPTTTAKNLSWRDFRSSKLPAEISAQAVEKALHYRTADGQILSGARAVLKILEHTAGYQYLGKILQIPPLLWLAMLVYPIIALNRFFLYGPHKRIFFCKIAVALAFIVPMPITQKLWLGEDARFYALTPVFSFLPVLPSFLNYAVFYAILGLLVLICLLPRVTWLLRIVSVAYFAFSLFDQSRWMPYYVEFAVMLFVLSLFPWEKATRTGFKSATNFKAEENRALATLAIILIGIWFWSGMHKLNARYVLVGYPWMLEPFTKLLPESFVSVIHAFAYFSTPVESGGAILLLFAQTRKIGVLLITAMHLFILLCFGPLGLNWNESVWSWNVCHIALCWLIFWQAETLNCKSLIFGDGAKGSRLLHRGIALLFAGMPLLNFFGLWDDFFSHALYSWTTMEAEIELEDPNLRQELPEEMREVIADFQGRTFVPFLHWSFNVFESPPYHAVRVFKPVFAKVCKNVSSPDKLKLIIYHRPAALGLISPKEYYRCNEV